MRTKCPACNTENKGTPKFCTKCGYSFTSEKNVPLEKGNILSGRYEILELIKSGGMGAVYKAIDRHFDDICALKEMAPKVPSQEKQGYITKRFEEEAKLLRKLHHNNLPRVTDYFTERGNYYLVMDFIDGNDMETIIEKSGNPGLPEQFLTDCALQILNILSYLHSHEPPIIYRDLKPANIMVREKDGRIFLIDFGIARTFITEKQENYTVVGTQGYAPPEQYKGNLVPGSDVYALGATLHHLITGHAPTVPFYFEPVKKLAPHVSDKFAGIIEKTLKRSPQERYISADDMIKSILEEKTEMNKEVPFTRHMVKEVPFSGPVAKEIPFSGPVAKEVPFTRPMISEHEEIHEKPLEYKKIKENSIVIDVKNQKINIKNNNEDMIFIPGEETSAGSKETVGFLGSKWQVMPFCTVYLEPFYIDKYPVTNEEYEKFIRETGYKSEGSWEKYYNQQTKKHPVINITWYDANKYASWKGKRLPTQFEWERAARGNDFRTYPWGQSWDVNKCNNTRMNRPEITGKMIYMENNRGTVPVDSFPEGKSFYGVMDMGGNIWEWCNDWYYRPEGHQKNPQGPSSGVFKVLCGGSWNLSDMYCFWCATRAKFKPENFSNQIGFRCIKNV